VFGVVAVGKNPSNPSHANKFDIGATCYNPMDGSTFPCPDGGYVQTTVSETQLLGYTTCYQNQLMSLVLNPTATLNPVAKIAMQIDSSNPLKVNFDGTASLNASTYTWDFGGAGTADYTNGPAKPSFTYNVAGDYTVTLKVTGTCGPENIATSYVTLKQVPVARIAYQLTMNDLEVAFDGTPSLNETTYAWNFGDPASGVNNTSTLAAPKHTYSAGGEYTVTLTVTDGKGNSNTAQSWVNVDKLKPVARIKFQLDPSVPRKVIFDGTPSLYEYSYVWDFGGTGTADYTNGPGKPSFTYDAGGEHTVKLTVTGISGLTNTATTWVTVK
jgi:PKD repeat protein